MKILIKIALIISFPFSCFAESTTIIKLRELYYKAVTSDTDLEKFSDFLKSKPQVDQSILSGYIGVSYFIKAKHAWSPYTKLTLFNQGKEFLDKVIKEDPLNIELRFLRFSIQTNSPSFLSYNDKIQEDKKMILIRYSSTQDKDLKMRIWKYMESSNYCSNDEKLNFRKLD